MHSATQIGTVVIMPGDEGLQGHGRFLGRTASAVTSEISTVCVGTESAKRTTLRL